MNQETKSILVVEDDASQRGVLAEFLERCGYRSRSAPDAETALHLLEEEASDLVLMDVRMPGMSGLQGLERMRKLSPAPVVILITAFAEVRDAVEAMRLGAADYLEKPVDLEELSEVVAEAIGDPRAAPADFKLPPLPAGFVVASEAMKRVVGEAWLVAPTEATVLITGESGTGKERIAELIHQNSRQAGGPFVRVNCAAIPESLVESELFGHRKGAFTGAEENRLGRFESASGGTILLDEIGELPQGVQPKLLRILEGGSFERVGESATRHASVRVIAATNRDLERDVSQGTFREDLFWRLNVFRIHIPALRERRDEMAPLAKSFLTRREGERVRLSPAALRLLEAYNWPGNVRELANVIERASILSAGGVILPEHLPESVRVSAQPPRSPGVRVVEGGGVLAAVAADAVPLTVEEAERRAIREALQTTGGNRSRAAKLLGISRRTLLYRLKRYGGQP